jgi:hypothetical protein
MPIFALLILFLSLLTYELHIKKDTSELPPAPKPVTIVQTRENVTKNIWSQNGHLFLHSDLSILSLSNKQGKLSSKETLFNLSAILPTGKLEADKLTWNEEDGLSIEGLGDVHVKLDQTLFNDLFKQYL